MTTIKTETYRLPAHWASYLINDDASSFSLNDDGGDAEIKAINRWCQDMEVGPCVGCSDEPYFAHWNDGPNAYQGDDVLDYTFEVKNEI